MKYFDWEEWIMKIEKLFYEAYDATDDKLLKQNLESAFVGTRLLLVNNKMIKPRKFIIELPE